MVRLSVFLFCGCFVGAIGAQTVNAFSVTDPSKPIVVTRKQDTFNIVFESNKTTGFSWFLGRYDRHVFTVVSHQYKAPQSGLMGASGHSVWTFKVKSSLKRYPRTRRIQFFYARPWTNEGRVKRVVTVNLQ